MPAGSGRYDQVATFFRSGKASEPTIAKSKIPATTDSETSAVTCTQCSTSIFPPINASTNANPTVKNRRRFKNPASKKYIARKPKIANTFEV